MNVIDLLKSDHDKVEGLFDSFESAKKSDSAGEKHQIVEQICRELDVHAEVEEELFYPAVERSAQGGEKDEKAESSVKESYEEHALVKTLVSELKGTSARDDGQLDAKVKVLEELVKHHVGEEEGTLMPRAKKLLSSEELDSLGARLEVRKQELLGQSSASRDEPARRSRRGSSSRRSSSRSTSSGSPPTSRRSSSPSRRRSAASASSRSGRSSGAPRGSRGQSSSGKRSSR